MKYSMYSKLTTGAPPKTQNPKVKYAEWTHDECRRMASHGPLAALSRLSPLRGVTQRLSLSLSLQPDAD
jgi:hypothetical protein